MPKQNDRRIPGLVSCFRIAGIPLIDKYQRKQEVISSTPTKTPAPQRKSDTRSPLPVTPAETRSDGELEIRDLLGEDLLGNPLDREAASQPAAHVEAYVGSPKQKAMMLVAVILPLLGTAAAIAWMWQYGFMGWLYLGLMVGGWYLTGMGITIGFHRLLTHRSFESKPFVRWFWTAAGAMAVEGSPLVWCAIHRRHHQLSDHEGDPHSPHLHDGGFWNMLKGMWHAHTGWLFNEYWEPPKFERYVPDLTRDKIVMHIDRWYFTYVIASLIIPTAIAGLVTMSWTGALLGFIWGGLVRMLVTQHITWSINSVCHVFGGREFESGDLSTNNLIFGYVAHGEGWHNNHHAFPTSARHGLRWWQFDASWVVIRSMQMLGWVWNVKVPSERTMELKRRKT